MKGTLKSRTATITLSREEYINLWYHLTSIINEDTELCLKLNLPLTTAQETCKQLGELIEKMYEDWYSDSFNRTQTAFIDHDMD